MFKLKRSEDGQFYYVFVAENGETLCDCETMHNHKDVLKNINSLVWAIRAMPDNWQETNIIDETKKPL
jgi:uncharacterized protein YegP (UPF0339 family)